MTTYSHYLKYYLRHRPLFFAFIRPQEAFLFGKYKKLIRSPILDFGCGDGFFAKVVFNNRTIEVGLDIENDRTKNSVYKHVYRKINFYKGETIPYPTNHFKTVISNCVLEHVTGLPQTLKEIYRVLMPGGYFITSVMTNRWNEYLFGRHILGNRYVNFMKKIQKHTSLLSLKDWRRSFQSVGFEEKNVVGYMSKTNSQYLDVFHYLSVGSLVTYQLFKTWNVFPQISTSKKLMNFVEKRISLDVTPQNSAALFFVLKKKIV